MIRIDCPHCGLRDETEFTYGGDATLTFPGLDNTDTDTWNEYVFLRDNPRGRHTEYWQHTQGCRRFLPAKLQCVYLPGYQSSYRLS